jgi:hypothetical protein
VVLLPAHRPGAAEHPEAGQLPEAEELPGEEPLAEHPEAERDHLFPAPDNQEASLDAVPIRSPGITPTRMPDEETLRPILSVGTPIRIWARVIKRSRTC